MKVVEELMVQTFTRPNKHRINFTCSAGKQAFSKNSNCSPRRLAKKNVAKISCIRRYHMTDENPAVMKETATVRPPDTAA